jgi:GTP-binding protein
MKSVVIVGRPNVGKSTLFNRLLGRRKALTHDQPGMTRDRLSEIARLDDGRTYRLVDTGGLEYTSQPLSAFAAEIREQAGRAIDEADLILLVVDGSAGLMAEEQDIAQQLRPAAGRVIVVVNKIDIRGAADSEAEFYELGFDRVILLSAEHNINVEDLWEAIEEIVPESDFEEAEAAVDDTIKLAIIGRPNVGKSSLLNRMANEERAVVSEIAGTTRDAVDSLIEREGKHYRIIDTAGIRRKSKTTDQAEKLAVISARKAIERCDIVLILIDAVEGATAQDATVAGYAEELGKAAMILVNKWDLVEEKTTNLARDVEEAVRRKLKFLAYAPVEFISARSGRRVEKLFPTIDRIASSYRARFRTSDLNRILERAVREHAPAAVRGRPRRLYYATQLNTEPPTIGLFSNIEEPLHFSYKRYLENRLREELGLFGTPVHLVVKGRGGDAGTRGRGDAGTRRRGDAETRGRGDAGTRRRGGAVIGRRGDRSTR